MEKEIKIIKTHPDNEEFDDSELIREKLDQALSEHEKISRLVDYFVLGLFLVVIMYTVL